MFLFCSNFGESQAEFKKINDFNEIGSFGFRNSSCVNGVWTLSDDHSLAPSAANLADSVRRYTVSFGEVDAPLLGDPNFPHLIVRQFTNPGFLRGRREMIESQSPLLNCVTGVVEVV